MVRVLVILGRYLCGLSGEVRKSKNCSAVNNCTLKESWEVYTIPTRVAVASRDL